MRSLRQYTLLLSCTLLLGLLSPSVSLVTRPVVDVACHTRKPPKTELRALAQHAAAAASLFDNMRGPASMIAGSIVPLGFLAKLPIAADGQVEGWFARTLRRMYVLVTVASLTNVLLSVMYSTVASNQLTETVVAPAASVWALIQRDFNLAWLGTNAHFVAGIFGFMWMVGTRAYLSVTVSGQPCMVAASAVGMAVAGLLLMVSVVNRGVAAGGGGEMTYGNNFLALISKYIALLLKQATSFKTFGPLQLAAVVIASVSTVVGVTAAIRGSVSSS